MVVVQIEKKEGINRIDRMNRIKKKQYFCFYPVYPVHPVSVLLLIAPLPSVFPERRGTGRVLYCPAKLRPAELITTGFAGL
jgi:hypothetical protein